MRGLGLTALADAFLDMHKQSATADLGFGILLAAHGDRVATLAGRHLLTFLALAAALMSVPSDTAKGIGSILLITAATGSNAFGRVLRFVPFRWLGRVSYSLYLIHVPIIASIVYANGGPLTVGQ
jgi:peptidoglycan/LPS O-acetylase OafA/YrhL